jgi:2-dehydro-3-deoxy-L-rhamnonate dehydrogenase (NAD+)
VTRSPLVLVTGAGGDLGGAMARQLAATGHALALVEHPSAANTLERAVDECRTAGADVWSAVFDVTDADAVRRAVDDCVTAAGVPAGLVNNAGYQGEFAPIHRYPPADAGRVFAVNVLGAFHVLSVVGAAMAAGGNGGAIVNMASMAGVSGAPNMPAYSASKAAIVGLTKSAAKDLAPFGIRVNAVSPAFIGPGRMWDRQVEAQAAAGSQYFPREPEAVAAQMIASVPLRRYGSPAEVAAVVAYLLSPAASYVTGVNIEISGLTDRAACRFAPRPVSLSGSPAGCLSGRGRRLERLEMRTYSPKASEIDRAWHVIDADGLVLGRLCTEAARLLRGKHKTTFVPHLDSGDHVIVVNAAKVVLTSGKADDKAVVRHSGYPGGLKSESYAHFLARKPEDALRRSIRGMLPKGPLGRQMIKKLKVYAGPEHPHKAQQPTPLALAHAKSR